MSTTIHSANVSSTGNKLLKDISEVTPDLVANPTDVYDVLVPNTSNYIHSVNVFEAIDILSGNGEAIIKEKTGVNSIPEESEVTSDKEDTTTTYQPSINTTKYNTTEGFFVCISDVVNEDKTQDAFIFDKKYNILEMVKITGTVIDPKYGSISSKLRAGKNTDNLNEAIDNHLNGVVAKQSAYTYIDKVGRFDILLNKTDFSLNIDFQDEIVPITNEVIAKLKNQDREVQKLKIDVAQQAQGYKMGDRVMLYGPTGTGKTYDFLSSVSAMKEAGLIHDMEKITVTDGFEDLDFLAHIIPTPQGIRYQENRIVELFREASQGKKIAILIDELNRGNKSFLNFMLSLLDPVNGNTYTLNNFINDEIIEVPMENVFFMATMNLGGKYTGTNSLDEALFDRFNIVQYKGYNAEVESKMLDVFGTHKDGVKNIIDSIRLLAQGGEIRAPISTRGIKIWAEMFINTTQTPQDIYNTFSYCLLNRLTSVDDYGNPNQDEIVTILAKFKERGFYKV